jgi:hypothetical protein
VIYRFQYFFHIQLVPLHAGTIKYKVGCGPILEPAPKLPEDERLSGLLKQYYKNNPIRAKNRKKLFGTYCAGLSDEVGLYN